MGGMEGERGGKGMRKVRGLGNKDGGGSVDIPVKIYTALEVGLHLAGPELTREWYVSKNGIGEGGWERRGHHWRGGGWWWLSYQI